MTTEDTPSKGLEDRLNETDPLEAFQERRPEDAADKVRFLYQEMQERLTVRDRATESLLLQECQIGTRLNEVLRAHGWFNEVGEKENVQLNQELRNLDRERRQVYESAARDLLKIKSDLLEALLEYRTLRRRAKGFEALLAEPGQLASPSHGPGYFAPPLLQYLAKPNNPTAGERPYDALPQEA